MSSTTWINEVQNNCPKTIRRDAEIYLQTIEKKEEHISFLEEKFLDRDIPTGDKKEIKQKKLKLEISLEALVYNLHSLPDVMAQLIVVIVVEPLSSSLKKDYSSVDIQVPKGIQINPKNVIEKLKKLESALNLSCPKYVGYANLIKEIKDSFQSLLDSDEFQYINDLVNTIKHRHLISIEFRFKQSQGNVEEADWKFLSFTKDDKFYPEITVAKLLSQYKSKNLELFHIVGNKISSYVLGEKIVNPK